MQAVWEVRYIFFLVVWRVRLSVNRSVLLSPPSSGNAVSNLEDILAEQILRFAAEIVKHSPSSVEEHRRELIHYTSKFFKVGWEELFAFGHTYGCVTSAVCELCVAFCPSTFTYGCVTFFMCDFMYMCIYMWVCDFFLCALCMGV